MRYTIYIRRLRMEIKVYKLLIFLSAWVSMFITAIHLYSPSDTGQRPLGQRRLFRDDSERSERFFRAPIQQFNVVSNVTHDGFEIININRTKQSFEIVNMNRTKQYFQPQKYFERFLKEPLRQYNDVTNLTHQGVESISINRTKSGVEIKNFTSDAEFFKLRQKRLTSYDYNYLITSDQICDKNENPFLVILCLTQHDNVERRASIRNSWGSIVGTHKWPRTYSTFSGIKMVFLFGKDNDNFTQQGIVNKEHKQYRDVVQADFLDSYYNLTIKVLMGLKWVNIFCPQAKFALKVDDDTFIHVPNLVNDLLSITVPQGGAFIGNSLATPLVVREGKWMLSEQDYPFDRYPEYLSGNSYVISGDVISKVLHGAERMPYISIEDAFITGIIRTAIGGSILHRTGYTYASERAPKMCGFHNRDRISATRVGALLCGYLWRALHFERTNCYKPPIKATKI